MTKRMVSWDQGIIMRMVTKIGIIMKIWMKHITLMKMVIIIMMMIITDELLNTVSIAIHIQHGWKQGNRRFLSFLDVELSSIL